VSVGCMEVSRRCNRDRRASADNSAGIGPKVTQSVITAAFLFAFKDVLYEATIKARRKIRRAKAVRRGPAQGE
jgi:hypothetical protein